MSDDQPTPGHLGRPHRACAHGRVGCTSCNGSTFCVHLWSKCRCGEGAPRTTRWEGEATPAEAWQATAQAFQSQLDGWRKFAGDLIGLDARELDQFTDDNLRAHFAEKHRDAERVLREDGLRRGEPPKPWPPRRETP